MKTTTPAPVAAHTPSAGAVRAAKEIQRMCMPPLSEKQGSAEALALALLIDGETAAPDLLFALSTLIPAAEMDLRESDKIAHLAPEAAMIKRAVLSNARAAIARATQAPELAQEGGT